MEDLTARTTQLLRQLGVQVVYLFGSRAEGTARADSDVDIAILVDRELTYGQQDEIGSLVAGDLGVPDFDIVDLNKASLEMRGKVVQSGRVLISFDEGARVRFEGATRAEYLDFRPILDRLTKAFLARIAREGLRGRS